MFIEALLTIDSNWEYPNVHRKANKQNKVYPANGLLTTQQQKAMNGWSIQQHKDTDNSEQ